jgi:hypothetical protein
MQKLQFHQNSLQDSHFIITEEDLVVLTNQLKTAKKILKERNKPKTLTISGNDHYKIKNYCKSLNLNIGEWASKVLLKEIDDNSCLIKDSRNFSEEVMEENINNLRNKYSTKKPFLVKSNVILINNQFIFKGYSVVDSKPIYDYIGTPTDLDKYCEIDNFESSDIQISCKIQNLHLELINSPVEPNQDLRVVYKL